MKHIVVGGELGRCLDPPESTPGVQQYMVLTTFSISNVTTIFSLHETLEVARQQRQQNVDGFGCRLITTVILAVQVVD